MKKYLADKLPNSVQKCKNCEYNHMNMNRNTLTEHLPDVHVHYVAFVVRQYINSQHKTAKGESYHEKYKNTKGIRDQKNLQSDSQYIEVKDHGSKLVNSNN